MKTSHWCCGTSVAHNVATEWGTWQIASSIFYIRWSHPLSATSSTLKQLRCEIPWSTSALKCPRNLKMKFSSLATIAAFAASAAAAPQAKPKSYSGYTVFRVNTHGQTSSVEAQLANVTYDEWDSGPSHIDLLIGPDDLATFESLGLESRVMHKDLGESLSVESAGLGKKYKRQVDDLAWFDSYHNYEDHIQYFNDLQRVFPNNSEIISSGRSNQGRNIFGLHVYGNDGPGKPAVLYHGTVHAREWITAPVCRPR